MANCPPNGGLGEFFNATTILVENAGNIGYDSRPVSADDRNGDPFSLIILIHPYPLSFNSLSGILECGNIAQYPDSEIC